MAENVRAYDIAVIRNLLIAAFNAEDLKRFCQDRPALAAVLPRFGPGQGLDDMVDEVIDYCQKQLLWDELLADVKQKNPRQFAHFEPALYLPTGVPFPRRVITDWRQRVRQLWPWLVGAPVLIVALTLGIWWLLPHGPGPAAKPTSTPSPTPTSTPSPVPTPSPIPTATRLPEPYHAVWRAVGGENGLLGLPAATAVSRRYSVQEFEHGLMFFRDNKYQPPENWIYVVYWGPGDDKMAGNSWVRYVDTWLFGDPALSCAEAAPQPLGPAAGFGRVWCERSDVRTGLGAAIQQEANIKGGWLDFAHGVMLYDIWNKRVFVLFENQHWRAFSD